MLGYTKVEVKSYERGLVFVRGVYKRMLGPGTHRFLRKQGKLFRVEVINLREPVIQHSDLDVIASGGELESKVTLDEVRGTERAFVWANGSFYGMFGPGRYAVSRVYQKVEVWCVDVNDVTWTHKDVAGIVASGALGTLVDVVDLTDRDRVLVWQKGKLRQVLGAGSYLVFHDAGDVRLEWMDISEHQLSHPRLAEVIASGLVRDKVDAYQVNEGECALVYVNGAYRETLKPGLYAYWRGTDTIRVRTVNLMEEMLDISGQEIMTGDKVTLRLNAVLTYAVSDPLKFATASKDTSHSLYREAQLALREAIGTRTLDTLLSEKDGVASELTKALTRKLAEFGVALKSFGIRDVILPGDMKELLNKVIEAKKAGEAALITRREETAAARMQANTARLLAGNPELVRMRELEALEKVSQKANLTVVLGEGGLTERITKLL